MHSYVECSIEDLYFKIHWNGKGLEKCTAYNENKGMSLREQTEIYLNTIVLNSEVWKEILPIYREHFPPNLRTSELGRPLRTERNRLNIKKNLCSGYFCEQLVTPRWDTGFSQEEKVHNESLGKVFIQFKREYGHVWLVLFLPRALSAPYSSRLSFCRMISLFFGITGRCHWTLV